MIKTEQISDKLIKSYSDNNKMIKPAYDRLGKPIPENAMYDEAIDIIVDGMPRYYYIETDIDRVIEKVYVGADGIEVVRENAETIEEE